MSEDYTPAGIGDNGGPPLEPVVIRNTLPQFKLITTQKQFPAFVGGFGSGKTAALIKRAIAYKLKYPSLNIAYYLPTYDLVRTIANPRFQEALAEVGLMEKRDYRLNKSDATIEIFGAGMIIMRTMDNPGRIVGYEVADSFVDELDTMKHEDASAVWKQILARNRQKKPDGAKNTIAVGTTPEGFKFVYEQWKKKPPSDEYQLIKASTYSNQRNLPETYIQDLIDAYPANLIQAYLNGEFINLTAGSVYPEYDRIKNASMETIQPGNALHIGLDFNVTKMAAVVFVARNGIEAHAVAELVDMFDTPAAIATIKSKFPGHPIFVYPDASGNSRKSVNASVSDIALLEAAGFTVCNNASNPFVKDRVLSVNTMILNARGQRKLRVNTETCPHFAEALEKQAYDKNGEPDKTSGLDHVIDAGGYFIHYRFPVVRPGMVQANVAGT